MKVRVARKIILRGLPDTPTGKLSPREALARKVVLRRWARLSYANGSFVDEREPHNDHHALRAQELRRMGPKRERFALTKTEA